MRLALDNSLVESMAPRHAMTPGFKIRELASESAAREWTRGEATKFINEKIGEATAMQNFRHNQSRVSDTALYLFGQGAHPIMDGASPAHREFQVYDLAPYQTLAAVNPLLAAALYAHDMDTHSETESRQPTLVIEEAYLEQNEKPLITVYSISLESTGS